MAKKLNTAAIAICLTVTIIAAICLCSINAPATAASSELGGYFKVAYDPAVFSKSAIVGTETFNVTIHGNATCIKEPPLHPSKGRVAGNIIAVHTVSGTELILQSSYTIAIEPFPSHLNDFAEMTVTAPLQFPADAETGEYSIIAKTIKAEVWVFNSWFDVTDMIPESATVGTVSYTPASITPTPTPDPGVTPTPTPTSDPSATPTPTPTSDPGVTPTPTPTSDPGATPTPTETNTPGTTTTPTETPVSGVTPKPTESIPTDGSNSEALPWIIIGSVFVAGMALLILAIVKRRASR